MSHEDDQSTPDWRTYSENLGGDAPGQAPAVLAEPVPAPENTAMIRVNPGADSDVVKLQQEALQLLDEANLLTLTEVAHLKPATDSLALIKGLKTALETMRTSYTVPINGYLKGVNDSFKVFTDPLNQADDITRKKVLAFRAAEEEKRKAQERINALREEAAREEMTLTGELSEPVGMVEVQPALHSASMTNMGTAGTRTTWKWEVEDISKVPMEYMIIDAAKVGKVVRAGLHAIPGLRIYEEQGLSVSVNKG